MSIIESKKCTPIAEIEALLYGHETRLTRDVQQTQYLVTPSPKYTQSTYSRGGNQQGGFHGSSHGGGSSARGCGHKFANFQCQIYLKFGRTANVCHFRSDISFQPHEPLFFIDPVTQQSIPFSVCSNKTSNTWTNPNTKSTATAGPSASFHVTSEPLNIKQMQQFNGPDQIFIGNGVGFSISGVGSSSFVSPFYS